MLQTDHLLTADEYLIQERLAKERHEFVDGEAFAMAGTSRKHNITNQGQSKVKLLTVLIPDQYHMKRRSTSH